MDKVQSFINEVDAVLRHETEQDGMQARTERVFADLLRPTTTRAGPRAVNVAARGPDRGGYYCLAAQGVVISENSIRPSGGHLIACPAIAASDDPGAVLRWV